MKKKLISVFATLFILFSCFAFTACGDKYKDLEFKVSYAFSPDSEWIEAGDKIDIHYGAENDKLIFDEDSGMATVYVKVEIKNVKEKNMGSISVSASNFNGLQISKTTISSNESFAVQISNNLTATLNFYDNNSGKTNNCGFSVYKSLINLAADNMISPAVSVGSSIDLKQLNNIIYTPSSGTNELGVDYSVEAIGYFNTQQVFVKRDVDVNSFLRLNGSILSLQNVNGWAENYAIKVKATSKYHQDKSVEFYVYAYESVTMNSPVVKYVANTDAEVSTINLYDGFDRTKQTIDYSSAVVYLDDNGYSSFYANGRNSHVGRIEQRVSVYVNETKYDYEKVNIGEALDIVKLADTEISGRSYKTFKISLTDQSLDLSKVKFSYEPVVVFEINGNVEKLNFAASDQNTTASYETEISVKKSNLAGALEINNVSYLDGDSFSKDVYMVANTTYKGYPLKLSANPSNYSSKLGLASREKIWISGDVNKVTITYSNGREISSSGDGANKIYYAYHNETVYVKFNENNSETANLIFSISSKPSTYLGVNNITDFVLNTSSTKTSETDRDYINVSFTLNKTVTADSLQIYTSYLEGAENLEVRKVNVDLTQNTVFYVKANYTGNKLKASSIVLNSTGVKFEDGSTSYVLTEDYYLAGEGYKVYAITLLAPNKTISSTITVAAGEGLVGVETSILVNSVETLSQDEVSQLTISTTNPNVTKFDDEKIGSIKYGNIAIVKGTNAEFNVLVGGNVSSAVEINQLYLKNDNAGTGIESSDFSSNNINVRKISSSVFDLSAYSAGKTSILVLDVRFYKYSNKTIILANEFIQVKVAVFESINRFNISATRDSVAYINSQYDSASESEISFMSISNGAQSPASSIVFNSNNPKTGASQVRINVAMANLKNNKDNIVCKFVSTDNKEIDLLDLNSFNENGNIATTILYLEDQGYYIQGKIVLQLKADISQNETGKKIAFTFEGLSFFGSNDYVTASSNYSINLPSINYAKNITCYGNELVDYDGDTELQLSFKNVGDGQYATGRFNIGVEYDNDPTKVKYEEISYKIEEFNVDQNGKYTADDLMEVSQSRLNVVYNNGEIVVSALKELGGGIFKLTISTKDSFSDSERVFKKSISIIIRVSDGTEKFKFMINNQSDLEQIVNNMSAHYLLGADIGSIENPIEIEPIKSGTANFSGTLAGTIDTSTGKKVFTIYIKLKNSSIAESYGYMTGLFAVIEEGGKVENLNICVSIPSKLSSSSDNGYTLGAVAAVNNGTISNVNVNILGCSTSISNTSDSIRFGGIVGLNNTKGKILNSTVTCLEEVEMSITNSQNTIVGLFAGENKGIISGSYLGNKSLNTISFNSYSNLKLINETNPASKYIVGGVVGDNSGDVKQVLVSGKIEVINTTDTTKSATITESYIGGICGQTSKSLTTVGAIGLNLSGLHNVAGIAGNVVENLAEINNAKFISANIEFEDNTTKGILQGKNVAGIAIGSVRVVNSSVESFVEDNVIVGENVYGLAKVEQDYMAIASFVKANLEATDSLCLTTNKAEIDTYFMGSFNFDGTAISKASYKYVDMQLNGYPIIIAATLTSELFTQITTDIVWEGLTSPVYYVDNYVYTPTSQAVDGVSAYYTFNYKELYVIKNDSLVRASAEYDKNEQYYSVSINENDIISALNLTFDDNSAWAITNNVNYIYITIDESDYKFALPYLNFVEFDVEDGWIASKVKGNKIPLLIIGPDEISASIVEITNSNKNLGWKIEEYNTNLNNFGVDYEVSETIIVNFYELKTSSNIDNENLHKLSDLIDITVLPEIATGGLTYEIVGDGYKYAYLTSGENDEECIVFTKASGSKPIIIKITSLFATDKDAVTYVALYSQLGLNDINLIASQIEKSGNDDYDFIANLYSGEEPQVITFDATNIINGKEHKTVFDAGLEDLILVVTSSNGAGTKLFFDPSDYNDGKTQTVKVGLKSDANNFDGTNEVLTFDFYLKYTYFGKLNGTGYLAWQTGKYKIKSVTLNCLLHQSATDLSIENNQAYFVQTNETISVDVDLQTGYVGEDDSKTLSESEIKIHNDIVYLLEDNKDSLIVSFDYSQTSEDNKSVIGNLLRENKLDNLAQLFKYEISFEKSQYGYKYKIQLSIKDIRSYRYITTGFGFELKVQAKTNAQLFEIVEINFVPTEVSTVRMESYRINRVQVGGQYANLIGVGAVETSVISPGESGDVLMIYVNPSYANIEEVTLTSSSLYVPSLNKDVTLKYTQLVKYNNNFITYNSNSEYIQNGDTLKLKIASSIDNEGVEHYEGVLYVAVQLEKFSGLESSISTTLTVKTQTKNLTLTKSLLTSFLPGASISYEGLKTTSDSTDYSYYIQKGSNSNSIDLRVYGYQYNDNPIITPFWNLVDGSSYSYVDCENISFDNQEELNKELEKGSTIFYIEDNKFHIASTLASKEYFKVTNKTKIKAIGDTNEIDIKDYVVTMLSNGYKVAEYDAATNSYLLNVRFDVNKDIPCPFGIGASMSLVSTDGTLKQENSKDIIFYPTDYILQGVKIYGIASNGSKDLAVNRSLSLDLVFQDAVSLDNSDEIKNKLNDSTLLSLFSCYYNNEMISFDDANNLTIFEIEKIGNKVRIIAREKSSSTIQVILPYCYKPNAEGIYSLTFGETEDYSKDTRFDLNIFVSETEENAIPISSADEMFNSSGECILAEGQHYILVEDIDLTTIEGGIVPINFDGELNIASLDGNNKVIYMTGFKTSEEISYYGLFGQIGSYELQDGTTKQTILKNVVVDYSKVKNNFADNGKTVLNFTSLSITFGGLVGYNNGLIYNCDVANFGRSIETINLIVPEESEVVFGGLVGSNNGVITNSRVGRSSYVSVNKQTTLTSTLNPIKFVIGAADSSLTKNHNTTAGGFVGINTSKIASCYVANFGLNVYSSDETSKTAGFVAQNSGEINYSYVKALETTISATNPYSTGISISNEGNGKVAGFVYTNTKTIRNCFANTELETKSAYIAGFVYANSGTIGECYSACTMNSGSSETYAEQDFVGKDSKGDLVSDSGVFENIYYLIDQSKENYEADATATGLNEYNISNGDNLYGFAFILNNSVTERDEGIWCYFNTADVRTILPELTSPNKIAYSYRYSTQNASSGEYAYVYASSCEIGSSTNPYIIRSVDEYNQVFKPKETTSSFNGYVRFIQDVDFGQEKDAIGTRVNYKLGSSDFKTSIDGNGMTISGIYFDTTDENDVESIGLFAEIENSYIKNLNLKFATSISNSTKIFSTLKAKNSGGLAGIINNSSIMNISITGESTMLAGKNFVGGLAGKITGESLIYNIKVKIGVKVDKTTGTENLYVAGADETNMSYAGGLAGVINLTKAKRKTLTYNLAYIDVYGVYNSDWTSGGIVADYAGGVAGFMNNKVYALKLKYHTATNDLINGKVNAGGLVGYSGAEITASQVTADEETQYVYDTNIGKYVIALEDGVINSQDIIDTSRTELYGNLNLLKSENNVGGLVGSLNGGTIKSCYAKVGIVDGKNVGGLAGFATNARIDYSYAIPFVNNIANSKLNYVGGLVGYGAANKDSEKTLLSNVFATLILNSKIANSELNLDVKDGAVYDYVAARNKSINVNTNKEIATISMGNDASASYYGKIKAYSGIGSVIPNSKLISKLYNQSYDSEFEVMFAELFGNWEFSEFWTLDSTKYFPLLLNEEIKNYIEIKTASDFEKVLSNPSGNFRVVRDIDMSTWVSQSNWILKFNEAFSGTIVGKYENPRDTGAPRIYGISLTTENDGTSSGFFNLTNGATIRNLKFEWENYVVRNAIKASGISLISCSDTGSQFTNLTVELKPSNDNPNGLKFNNGGSTVGFASIVGEGTNSKVSYCTFRVNNNLDLKFLNNNEQSTFFGGIVGQLKKDSDGESAVITNSQFGDNEKQVNINFAGAPRSLTIGGIVADISAGVTLSKNNLANIDSSYADRKHANFKLSTNQNTQINLGGIVGKSTNSDIINNHASLIVDFANQKYDATLKLGGLAGIVNATKVEDCSAFANFDLSNYQISETRTANQALYVSTGVADSINSDVLKAYFAGNITSSQSTTFGLVCVGGAVAVASGTTLSQVMTDCVVELEKPSVFNFATTDENKIKEYVGGIVGQISDSATKIEDAISIGRIIPRDADEFAIGGILGTTDNSQTLTLNNVISLCSIICDGLKNSNVEARANINALFGYSGNLEISNTSSNVYYSSDISLCGDSFAINKDVIKNYSAVTLLNSGKINFNNGSWSKLTGKDENHLPYLTALENHLVSDKILKNGITVSYEEGSVIVPMSRYESTDNFYYYNINPEQISTLKGVSFKGILIGTDEVYEIGLSDLGVLINSNIKYYGLVPIIEEHSAVSNLHVKLSQELEFALKVSGEMDTISQYGFIVGLNNGIVFNCSTQGTGLTFKGKEAGAGEDRTNTNKIAMIAGRNNGVVEYCYSSVEIISCAIKNVSGLVYDAGGESLIANSYFTGYIEGKDINAYGILAEKSSSSASPSYIYNSYMAGVIKDGKITKDATKTSFAGCSFDGKQNYIDKFANIEMDTEIKSNAITVLKSVSTSEIVNNSSKILSGSWYATPNNTIGYNYFYPIYQFNKLDAGDMSLDKAYQIKTGDGTSSSQTPTDLEDRFSKIANNNKDNGAKYYENAIKIPNLGLISIINTLSANKNYCLIYDIVGNGIDWTASQFEGVFLTNKYYGYSETNSNCKIENLKNNGLFEVTGPSYIGKIIFGSFENFTDSGIIGTSVDGDTTINNISFLDSATLSNCTGSSGLLFGSVGADLTLKNVNTEKVNKMTATSGYFGLIAGAQTAGKITLAEDNQLIAKLGKCGAIVGGLVGQAKGGSISAVSTTTIKVSTLDFVTSLGGIVGEVAGEYTIDKIQVLLENPTETLQANSFGGVAAIVKEATLHAEEVVIGQTDEEWSIEGNQNKATFYGLIVGEMISTNNKTASLKGSVLFNIKSLSINAGKERYDETNEECGVGALVGKINGNITDLTLTGSIVNTSDGFKISGKDIENVGGVAGIYAGGKIEMSNEKYFVVVDGTVNVGGAFGKATESINFKGDDATIKLADGNLFDEKFAKVEITGGVNSAYDDTCYRNYGGLFGMLTQELTSNENSIQNKNDIEIQTNGYIYNVGGVAGKFTGTSANNVENLGDIKVNDYATSYDSNSNDIETLVSKLGGNEQKKQLTTKAVNVGGVFGFVEGSSSSKITLSNIKNSSTYVEGYQNVGGLVGYSTYATINGLINLTSKQPKEDGSDFEDIEIDLMKDGDLNSITEYEQTEEESLIIVGGNKYKEIKTQITFAADENSSLKALSVVKGVVSVGGIVGYSEQSTIQKHFVTNKVLGNNMVGGIVGTADNSTIQNNAVVNKVTGEGNEEKYAEVKGLYFTQETFVKEDGEIKDGENKFVYIPSSIGGLVGLAKADTEATQSEVGNRCYLFSNYISDLKVTTADECSNEKGEDVDETTLQPVLTTMNYIYTPSLNVSSVIKDFLNAKDFYKKFEDVKTGVGGMVGTINSYSVSTVSGEDNKVNVLNNVEINAPLGINVGVAYGYYNFNATINDSSIEYPKITGTNKVDGSYNVGGLVGYFDCSTDFGADPEILTNLEDSSISVESSGIGMYVGGLFGKFNSNNQDNFKVRMRNTNISIDASKSYYVGGLVGKLCVHNTGFELEGDIGKYIVTVNNATFGGFVGMLKIDGSNSGSGISVNVKKISDGQQPYDFTINTIENGNYKEGAAKVEEKNSTTMVAQASYINQDSLNICGSDKEDLLTGPFGSAGWAKEYTMFKTMQRCISQPNENWDSIGCVFDAQYITGVGTTTTGDKTTITYTIYERDAGSELIYTQFGIGTRIEDANFNGYTPNDATNDYGRFLQTSDPSKVKTNHIDTLKKYYGVENIITPNPINEGEHPDPNPYFKQLEPDDLSPGVGNSFSAVVIVKGKDEKDKDIVDIIPKLKYYYTIIGTKCYQFDVIYATKGNEEADGTVYVNYEKNFTINDNETTILFGKDNNNNTSVEVDGQTVQYQGSYQKYANGTQSGCVFDAVGVNPTIVQVQHFEEKEHKLTPGEIAVYVAIILLGTTLLVLSGGLGAPALIALGVGMSLTGIIAGAITLADELDAVNGLAMQEYLQYQQNCKYADETYLTTTDVNLGLAAQANTRKVVYDDDGVIAGTYDEYIAVKYTRSNDKTETVNYKYYSTTRPADYYSHYYFILAEEEDDDNDDDNNKYKQSYKPFNEVQDLTTENIYKKYEFKNGAYYYHPLAANISYSRVRTKVDGISGAGKTTRNGATYVYGSFDGKAYSFDTLEGGNESYAADRKYNNKVSKTGDKYYINGYEITDSKDVEYTKILNYECNNIRELEETDIKGYDYFEGLYYTVNGDSSKPGIVGKFVKGTNITGLTENVDYIKFETYKYKLNGTEIVRSSPEEIYKAIYGENVEFSGSSLKINGNDATDELLDIKDSGEVSNEYILKTSTYYIFEGNDVAEIEVNENTNAIYVNLYPYGFINPYKEDKGEYSACDNKKYFKVEKATDNSIPQAVTYYLFESGYETDVTLSEDKTGEATQIYTEVEKTNGSYIIKAYEQIEENGEKIIELKDVTISSNDDLSNYYISPDTSDNNKLNSRYVFIPDSNENDGIDDSKLYCVDNTRCICTEAGSSTNRVEGFAYNMQTEAIKSIECEGNKNKFAFYPEDGKTILYTTYNYIGDDGEAYNFKDDGILPEPTKTTLVENVMIIFGIKGPNNEKGTINYTGITDKDDVKFKPDSGKISLCG